MDTPIMKGRFGWQDISGVAINPQAIIFGFGTDTPNGRILLKNKKYYSAIIIPFSLIDENTKQELIELAKMVYQQGGFRQLHINKKLR